MKIIDLSMTIQPHFRWKPAITIKGDKQAGDQFRVTSLTTTCHGFSHVDAQAHFIANGPTIEQTPLETVVGPCRVFDLAGTVPDQAIDAAMLAAADPGGPASDILLLATQWDLAADPAERRFWTEAPYLTRDAAEYLLACAPSAVAVDFPQDYPIRLLLDGIEVPDEDHVTHDVLLRSGVTLIEYVANTAGLTQRRILLSAAPLKIANADGAPARIYAIEGLLS